MSIMFLSWLELRELVLSGVCWGNDTRHLARCQTLYAVVSELKEFSFSLLPTQAALPANLIDGVPISLSGGDIVFIADCFNQRMSASPSSLDGEDADNDLLDVLLPLHRKLQLFASNFAKEVSYQLVVIGKGEE